MATISINKKIRAYALSFTLTRLLNCFAELICTNPAACEEGRYLPSPSYLSLLLPRALLLHPQLLPPQNLVHLKNTIVHFYKSMRGLHDGRLLR
jgi:hypothetical protein